MLRCSRRNELYRATPSRACRDGTLTARRWPTGTRHRRLAANPTEHPRAMLDQTQTQKMRLELR
eukprot:5167980-Lingulodinium_polyedra.AAC.1